MKSFYSPNLKENLIKTIYPKYDRETKKHVYILSDFSLDLEPIDKSIKIIKLFDGSYEIILEKTEQLSKNYKYFKIIKQSIYSEEKFEWIHNDINCVENIFYDESCCNIFKNDIRSFYFEDVNELIEGIEYPSFFQPDHIYQPVEWLESINYNEKFMVYSNIYRILMHITKFSVGSIYSEIIEAYELIDNKWIILFEYDGKDIVFKSSS